MQITNSFYTILYCPIRPIIDERISVALLMKIGERVFFRYSIEKLKIAKGLLPLPAYNLLKSSLRNIDKVLCEKELDGKFNELALNLNTNSTLTKNYLKQDYISYLNSYSNNLIHFSNPKSIDVSLVGSGEDIFNSLFQKLIFISEPNVELEKKGVELERVKTMINPSIKSHVNLNVELTSRQISSLIVPTPLWFIGKNDQDVTGEVVNFEKPTRYLENDIRDHLYLLQSLRNSKRHYQGKHFLVGSEPAKTNNIGFSIWESLRDVSYITFISPNEADTITEYILEHNVEPYFSE